MRTHRLIVAYDVSDDDNRARLAALLSTIGVRIQRSVFAVDVREDELEALQKRIATLLDETSDRVEGFRRCEDCEETSFRIGAVPPPIDARWWIL
jgi:CRISPR-associated protein Cas2